MGVYTADLGHGAWTNLPEELKRSLFEKYWEIQVLEAKNRHYKDRIVRHDLTRGYRRLQPKFESPLKNQDLLALILSFGCYDIKILSMTNEDSSLRHLQRPAPFYIEIGKEISQKKFKYSTAKILAHQQAATSQAFRNETMRNLTANFNRAVRLGPDSANKCEEEAEKEDRQFMEQVQ